MVNEREKDVEKEFVFIQQRKKRARNFYKNIKRYSIKRLLIDEKYAGLMTIDLFGD